MSEFTRDIKQRDGETPWVFSRDIPPGKEYTADKPHRLAVYLGICVHLAEVSSSDNLHNGHPSTLLRYVPVGNERCGSGKTETFHVLQC